MKKQKTIKAWVYLKSINPTKWLWFCSPFLRVGMEGTTKTSIGAKRAAKRTIERIGCKADIKILRPKNTVTRNNKD